MRWLHISDIHVPSNGIIVDVKKLMKEFYEELQKVLDEKPVDCIVFSGDLFNRGTWTNMQSKGATEILHQIYEICSLKGNWGWCIGTPMDRLFYCPGNHDVLREAYLECNGEVLHRKKILQSTKTISNDGSYCASGDTNTLLTKKTFGLFHDTMRVLCGSSSNASDYEYQYRIFNMNNTEPSFCFVGINTALLAAQEYPEEAIEKELFESYADFQRYHAVLDTKDALDAYRRYARAINKKLGNIKNDEGRLCFISEAAQKSIRNSLQANYIPILFGHHPLSFLSEEAKKQAILFANSNRINIYLCGHTHKSHGDRVDNPFDVYFGRVDDSNLYQITVGGLFYDQSGYNETSFSIGEIFCVSDTVNFSIYTHMMCKNVFGKLYWQISEERREIHMAKIDVKDATGQQDKHTEKDTSSAAASGSNEKKKEKEDEQAILNETTEKVFRRKLQEKLNQHEREDKQNG